MTLLPLPARPSAAIVTASYAPDFERCRLLCETIDRHVSGMSRHLILVEGRDVALFKALEGPRRTVIDERALLPSWIRSFPDPLSLGRRRVWLSLRTPPLRGWHAQQLRRIAVADAAVEDLLVFCDSDVAFVRPFDLGRFAENGRARLYRVDGALPGYDRGRHRDWWQQAGRVLGLPAGPADRSHDYISTLIAWRRDATLAMRGHVEARSGRHWAAAIASSRQFSECLIYGRFADEVLGGEGHFADPHAFCRIHWTGQPLSEEEFSRFLGTMEPQQVAVGMQSFIGTDLGRIRRTVLGPASGFTLASQAA